MTFVVAYVLLVHAFYAGIARWTHAIGGELGMAVLLLLAVLALSLAWFGLAYVSSRFFGVWVPLGTLAGLTRLPAGSRHVVLVPPKRPDTRREMWGRFGLLLTITIGLELLYLLIVFHGGDLSPRSAVSRPARFFSEEALAGLLLAVLLAPAAPFFQSRFRLRIVDALEFPLLWLTLLVLAIGGVTAAALTLLPRVVLDPGLFFLSILLYAPSAWYVALAYSRAETATQRDFLRRAWSLRSPRFHFGRLHVEDEASGRVWDV